MTTARTVLHEARHVWQRIQAGPIPEPKGSDFDGYERDARESAAKMYERIRAERYPSGDVPAFPHVLP